MFRIESYITSIILSNADRYIKNFRKQDAQVSLWEGDATFHNIDLNVDALNEELRSSFAFISGYIHDLTIHVPWTKLMSEPVIISVNTIECVMRLKSRDEKLIHSIEKISSPRNLPSDNTEKRSQEEISPPSSYMSSLTSKIMNNLLIRCKNVILKLVEEDIVFSMNIEELSFANVNEFWIQTMTDINIDKLLTRKLITLSGVTICLDKQNSSGRIDMYLEPLLYRCLIHIRILRCYDCLFSKKPIHTHIDILSDKMSFTISEPQIPMLLKLGMMIFIIDNEQQATVDNERKHINSESTVSSCDSTSHISENYGEENNDASSWGEWLWSMMPTILPLSDDDASFEINKEKEFNPTLHIGFFVKNLEMNLKISNNKLKKNSKSEFKNVIKSSFTGCIYRMDLKNSDWLNIQFGVNHVSIENPSEECTDEYHNTQFYKSGTMNENCTENTLFDEKVDFSFINVCKKIFGNVEDLNTDFSDSFENTNTNFFYQDNFSINRHLNLYTENILLEKTPAFAIDYVKYYQYSVTMLNETNNAETEYFDQTNNGNLGLKLKNRKENILVRFISGSGVMKVTSDAVSRFVYLQNIISNSEYLNYRASSELELKIQTKRLPNRTVQFTVFDLNIEIHSSSSSYFKMYKPGKSFSDIPENLLSHQHFPVLILSCKCIDGKIKYIEDDAYGEIEKITSVKAVEIICSLLQSNFKSHLLKCEKLDWESSVNMSKKTLRSCLGTKKVVFTSSRENLSLSKFILMYLMYSVQQSERKHDYYSKIYFSSLINDALLRNNTVLEILLDSIIVSYESTKEALVFSISLNCCKAYACKLKNDVLNKVIIFNTVESTTETSNIHLKLQHCINSNDERNYPSCVLFNLKNFKINLDVMFYSWITYEPVPLVHEKLYKKMNTSPKEHSLSKSGTSRKISDASSGSHGRRYAPVYPKPKESVHSSSDPEIHSPPEITDTEQSDVFHFPDTTTAAKKNNLVEYLTNNTQLWCNLIVHGEISQIIVYIPTGGSTCHRIHEDVEQAIKELFQNNMYDNSKLGIFVFTLKLFKIKCDVPLNISEEFNSSTFISMPKSVWSADKLTFPWVVSVEKLTLSTLLENCVCKPLLKPLSINCTVSVSVRENEKNESVVALCVHFDFQSILVSLTEKQVLIITSVVDLLKSYRKLLTARDTSTLNINAKHVKPSIVGNLEIDNKKPKKLTGWIQWTFTKCSLVFYSNKNSEYTKLFLETEDSIMSLEFDKTFYKVKLKISSFGIYHHIRYSEINPWKSGPFYGVIVQRSYTQPLNSNKTTTGENDDRFLLATITSARSSNLKSRLLSSNVSEISTSSGNDNFITEIILKICSMDVIIPLIVIEKFLSVLKPLMEVYQDTFGQLTVSSETRNKEKDISSVCLPFIYFDMPMTRIFIPTTVNVNAELLYDTFICEIGSVHADCNPENPIIHKRLLSDIYYSTTEKKYAKLEQKLQNQQYELHIADISLGTSLWSEIEQMLSKEQLWVEEPPSAFEQNPAVMWNQGCHPDTKNKFNLRHLSPIIYKFNLQILIAPSVQYHTLKTVHSAYYEVNMLSEIEVAVSLYQIPLFFTVYTQYQNYINSYFENIKEETKESSNLPSTITIQSRMVDSGIESMDQSSVESSAVSKMHILDKSEVPTSYAHHINSKNVNPMLVSRTSGTYQKTGTIFEHEIFKEIYVTAQKIRFTLYKTCKTEEDDKNQLLFNALLFSEIIQPYFLLNFKNNNLTSQFSVFNVSVRSPSIKNADLNFSSIPGPKEFPVTLFSVRKCNHDPYSKIKFPCFTLKTTLNMNKKWKIDVNIEQPVFINLDISAIRYVETTMHICVKECEMYYELFNARNEKQFSRNLQISKNQLQFADKLKICFQFIATFNLSTSRIFIVFKSGKDDYCSLLYIDNINVNAKSPNNLKNSAETLVVQWELKSITLSLPKIRVNVLCDILCGKESSQSKNSFFNNYNTSIRDHVFTNIVLKPWSVNVEFRFVWQSWDLLKKNPWKYVTINSDCIVCDVNPDYVNCFSDTMTEYTNLYRNYFDDGTDVDENKNHKCVGNECYKDDLRAGTFQYVKCENDKCEFLSPYEIVFCNRQMHSFISWKYPQPRYLTKLQIYPVPLENTDENDSEISVHCQLQYYDEIRNGFISYVSFDLPEDSIQNVVLPNEKLSVTAAECWRIILFEPRVTEESDNSSRIDVKLFAGCVRVDSCFQPAFIPSVQFLVNITEIQINFFSLSQFTNVMIENYTIDYIPNEQQFLSVIFNDIKMLVLDYGTEKMLKLSGIVKANVLNYEYLMMQSFVNPFFIETAFYFTKGLVPKLAVMTKAINLRINPNLIHTLSVSHNLWKGRNSNTKSSMKITAPYVICNNTNHVIALLQENIDEKIYLFPSSCHLFAWFSHISRRNLQIIVHLEKKSYSSEMVNIRKIGCTAVTCVSDDEESCSLFVSIIKHSSVVYQVVIYGSLLLYNLTHSEMDMCVMSSGGNKLKTKLSSGQLITNTVIKKKQLLSVVIPSSHKLSFKVRYSASSTDSQRSQWSGLIPLVTSQRFSNQTSWMVKIPLKNYKEHFQSLWCQVTCETVEGFQKYLVVFRPMCSVTSFLPWKSYVNVLNDIGSSVNTSVIAGRGDTTDLFIRDTVSLDRYVIEWKQLEGSSTTTDLCKIKFDKSVKSNANSSEYSIHSLIEEISTQNEDNNWPFLHYENKKKISWKTDKICEIKPIIKILRKEENGCGTKIELYPWAIIINMLNYKILLDISENTMYTIECHEIIAPPRIESTFKLGLVENDQNYLSGTLQLFDNEAVAISKVMDRIPVNGFITTMIDCDTHVTFVNVASKYYKEMRIVKVCSSYIISNKSDLNASYAAMVVCRDRNKKSKLFDVPNNLKEISVNLQAGDNEHTGQAITKWYKVGNGDVQVLPYLLLSIDGHVGCPIRICDLSEKEQYPIIFSSTPTFSKSKNPPCIFITAQQNEGQVFLSIWDEKVPQITINNMSQLSLNVISSKSENKIEGISYCPNWNWKFCVTSESSAHFHIHKKASQNNKKITDYLAFSVSNNKRVNQIKWSSGVPLTVCLNKLITLPLSQHHIKLSIFKNGFTYIIWIESATVDELSARMIRTRLSESFHSLNNEVAAPSAAQNLEINNDETYDTPLKLINLYNTGLIKPYCTNIFIEEISTTIAYDNEISFEENDIGTFCAQNLSINIDLVQKPNEVTEDICCYVIIENYQFNNEEYHLRIFDFPIVLASKTTRSRKNSNLKLHDLLLKRKECEHPSVKVIITFKNEKPFKFDIRDLEVFLNAVDVYLEDKYLTKLKVSFENILSATTESSNFEINYIRRTPEDDLRFKKCEILESKQNHRNSNGPDKANETRLSKVKSSSSKSVNVSGCDIDDKSSASVTTLESNLQNEENEQNASSIDIDEKELSSDSGRKSTEQWNENQNYVHIPEQVYRLSKKIARPLRLRNMYISSFHLTVSLHTSTTFYIALDSSPLNFSEFKGEYLVTSPFELGNLLTLHYFVGAIYGTGWAISSLEFVGSPGILARTLGTGIKDFVSMPIYGIASGPRGFVLGVAHGSASLMKHTVAGTLSSVTKFAGSWARTLDRFTLDPDDLLQCEEIRRVPPSNVVEGILQGLSEFGISLLGGISGIAHHPLQYAVSKTGNRSLINSISLGIVGVLTRPLSGAAELVAKTGQGILSHVGWNTIPALQNYSMTAKNVSNLQICDLKYQWNCENRDYKGALFTVEAVNAEDITLPLWIILTSKYLFVTKITNKRQIFAFDLRNYEFNGCDYDPTLITVVKPKLNYKNAEDFHEARILKYINESNRCFNVEYSYSAKENLVYCNEMETVYSFCVNPQIKNFFVNFISFVKNIYE